MRPSVEMLILSIVDFLAISAFCWVSQRRAGQSRAWLLVRVRDSSSPLFTVLALRLLVQTLVSDAETVSKMSEYNARGMGQRRKHASRAQRRGDEGATDDGPLTPIDADSLLCSVFPPRCPRSLFVRLAARWFF